MNHNFDFERIWEDNRRMRERLAAAPIAEKLRMLDAMRERAVDPESFRGWPGKFLLRMCSVFAEKAALSLIS